MIQLRFVTMPLKQALITAANRPVGQSGGSDDLASQACHDMISVGHDVRYRESWPGGGC